MSTIDEYLSDLPEPQKKELERIRNIVKQVVPEAKEAVSYGLPTFKYNKHPLIYFGAFKDHMSIYPASGGILGAIGNKLEKFRTSKGTLQFTSDNPIPESIIKEVVLKRLAEISKS